MKRLFAVAMAAACAVAQAETTGMYVQDGLIAIWDGYANDGAGGHATELTEWKDTEGNYSFVFKANSGITVGDMSLGFSGASGCYATMDAETTAATFDLAKDGTMEVVFKGAADRGNTSFVLRSSATSGIAAGNYNSQTSWIVSNKSGSPKPTLDGRGEYTTLVVHYADGVASASYVNGRPCATSGSNNWGSPQASTSLGANYDGSSRFKGEICAIRLYSSPLTPEQIKSNRAVDEARFIEGDFDKEIGVLVDGYPARREADGEPAYGIFPKSVGDDIQLSAPATVEKTADEWVYCSGWKLYDCATATLVDESTDTTCAFTYREPVRLVWQWTTAHLVTTTPAQGLTVSPAEAWVREGEKATFTVTGTDHPVWTVDGIVQTERGTNLTIEVSSAPLEISVAEDRAIYVTQDGAGLKDGSSWGNALAGLQAGLAAAKESGELTTVKVLTGDYPLEEEIFIGDLSNQTVIRGGYTGVNDEIGESRSVFYRAIEGNMRLFRAENSSLVFENLAFTNGFFKTTANGFALHLTSCTTEMRNCAVRENGGTLGSGVFYGSIYVYGGSFAARGCDISDNTFAPTDNGADAYGAGLYVGRGTLASVPVTLENCTFSRNKIRVQNRYGYGGAICADCTDLRIANCMFDGNYVKKTGVGGEGGAITFRVTKDSRTVHTCSISDCVFQRNWVGGPSPSGGCISFLPTGVNSAFYNMNVSLTRCVFKDNGIRPTDDPNAGTGLATDCGDVYFRNSSTKMLGVTNCVFIGTGRRHALRVGYGLIDIYRTTIANSAEGYGISGETGANITLKDSIIWGNASGGITLSGATLTSASYCDLQDGQAGTGNVQVDPLFADDGWGHLLSEAGYYAGGGFSGGAWTVGTATSPVLDAADPASAVGDEPQPNKHLANIGAYAGTEVASKSKLAEEPVVRDDELKVFAYGVTLSEGAATIRGEVASTGGGAKPTVSVVWDSEDKGTTAKDAWSNVRALGAFAPWKLFSSTLTDIAGPTVCRLVVENEEGTAFSDALSFRPPTRAAFASDVKRVQRRSVWATATVSDDGGSDVTLRARVWPADGSEEGATTYDFNFGQPVTVGTTYEMTIDGLTPGMEYEIRIEAVNGAGVASQEYVRTTYDLSPRTFYVSVTGAGDRDGSGASNALGVIQDAIALATEAGDEISLAAGTYTTRQTAYPSDLSYQVADGTPGLTLRGDPAGGTVLTIGDQAMRLFHAVNATVSFFDITFRGGRIDATSIYGHGVYGENSTLVFTRCTFVDNGLPKSGSYHYGAAIAANGGSAMFIDCTFRNNAINCSDITTNRRGGAIWAKDAALTAAGCLFATNYVFVSQHGGLAGAIYANGGSALITNCVFNGNYATHPRGYDGLNVMNGGAIYFDAVPSATIVDSVFDGNYVNNRCGGISAYSGGTIYLAGDAGVTAIARCKFLRGGVSGYATNTGADSGAITLAAGTASVVNTLVVGMHSNAFEVAGGTLAVTNVTVVGGDREPVLQKDGAVKVVNSIFWDNASEAGVSFDVVGGTTEVTYSDVLGGFAGEGNLADDPRLYGPTKARAYHLRSVSPCAGTGNAAGWTAADIDLDGLKRIRGTTIDMGCYSFNAPGLLLMLK